jgi:hypothetical protein
MEEVWRAIKVPGFEDAYQVSNLGRVKSNKRYIQHKHKLEIREEHLMALCNDKDGYKILVLKHNNKKKQYKVHRLVAEAFIPNPNNYIEINHKDENKANNNVNNLEWCSHLHNIKYGTRGKRAGEKTKRPIIQYDLDGNFIKEWNGTIDASKGLNIYVSNIWKCLNNKIRQTNNFIFKYKEDINE